MPTLAPQAVYQMVPADIVNLAMDSLGESGQIIGDINDGTKIAEAARRSYGLQLRGLLRAAHWSFARKQAQLELLGDATGQSPSWINTFVEEPWSYAYAWPTDGVAGRWMPTQTPLATQGAATTPSPPLNSQGPIPPVPGLPAAFLLTSSDQYPIMQGNPTDWSLYPDISGIEGLSLTGRRIILTNQQNACFVYTRLVLGIEEWDDLFRQAMVASMAAILATTAISEPKLRIAERDRHVAMAVNALNEARVASARESGYPVSTDHLPAWIAARNAGWGGASGQDHGGMGPGIGGTLGLYLPYAGYSLAGSVY